MRERGRGKSGLGERGLREGGRGGILSILQEIKCVVHLYKSTKIQK